MLSDRCAQVASAGSVTGASRSEFLHQDVLVGLVIDGRYRIDNNMVKSCF